MKPIASAVLLATLAAAAPAQAAAPGSRFKDWSLDCVAGPPSSGTDGSRVCLIQHEVRRPGSDAAAMVARVRFLGEQPMLLFLLPPNLPAKAELSYGIDDGATATAAVKDCNTQLCWAVVPIGAYLLASLKQGITLTVRMPAASGGLQVPLGGFTAAYSALQRMQH